MIEPSGGGLRVLLVAKGLDIGGIERMVVSLAKGLTERGHNVEVVIVNRSRDQLQAELTAAGIVVHALRGTDRIGWRGVFALGRVVRSSPVDIVHVHGPLPAIIARLVPGVAPIITTSHTPIGALHPLTRWMWMVTRRLDAAAVAVGSDVGLSIGSSVEIIPHAPDQIDGRSSRSWPEPGQALEVIVVASHRKVKNYPNLLEAIRIAQAAGARLRLTAVGEGPELSSNIELAATLGLAPIVDFEPPDRDVLARIATADVLVVSSDFEGQPLVVAEALALGTPVIATDVGRVAELVGPAVGRVVPTGDPAALAAALIEVAGTADLLERMGSAALKQAAAWTIDDVLDAHEALYRRVANGANQIGVADHGASMPSDWAQ